MEDSSEAITTTMVVTEDVAITLAEEVTVEMEATTTVRHAHQCRTMEDDRRLHRDKTQANQTHRPPRIRTNMLYKDQHKQLRVAIRVTHTKSFRTTTSTVGREAKPERLHQQETLLLLAVVGHDYRRVPTPTCKRVARWETTRKRTRKWRRQA